MEVQRFTGVPRMKDHSFKSTKIYERKGKGKEKTDINFEEVRGSLAKTEEASYCPLEKHSDSSLGAQLQMEPLPLSHLYQMEKHIKIGVNPRGGKVGTLRRLNVSSAIRPLLGRPRRTTLRSRDSRSRELPGSTTVEGLPLEQHTAYGRKGMEKVQTEEGRI
ncbi:hypothetical protein MUK42_02509 [Musa troglodytarum]|uniref:Uncharacterized protein n=1 Tax=Musa troglodytarum TaxID=320322 RepID=A0A9E7EQY3_9LILI|nr:hypothetical protein MUK42_02509 [Musa troglodytarum]